MTGARRANAPDADNRTVSVPENLVRVRDVAIEISVELGRKTITVAGLLELAPGCVVMLDRLADGGVDLLAADRLLAQGEVVAIDEEFGVRLSELYHRVDRPADATAGQPDELRASGWGAEPAPTT